jgi:hypothetical protein
MTNPWDCIICKKGMTLKDIEWSTSVHKECWEKLSEEEKDRLTRMK